MMSQGGDGRRVVHHRSRHRWPRPRGGAPGLFAHRPASPASSVTGHVALAAATLARPHLLLLDEPSNFLDMASVDALISGLRGYEGAVVLISHDAYLLQAVAPDALWVVERGRVERYRGSFAEYRSALRAAASAEKARKGGGGGGGK